jgi:ABC-type glycerol-3-phosphate transport system substrate-binding protein
MNHARKVAGVAALLIMVYSPLFGCGGDKNQVKPTSDGSVVPSTDAQASPIPQEIPTKQLVLPSDNGGGVITFATYSFLDDAYEPVLAEFHKQHPEITVQIKEFDYTWTPRQMATAADTTLLSYQPSNNGSYFLDLTPFEELDPTFEPDSFWPGILDACLDSEGRIYGLPMYTEPTGIFYSMESFDAAGLPYPQPGWTWEDFQKAVNTLARNEPGQQLYGYADDSFWDTPDETLLSPQISYLLDQTGGEIDAETFESELQWYLDLVKLGSLYSENIYPQKSPARAPENAEAWSTAWNDAWKVSQEMFLKNPPAMWKGRLDQVYWGNLNMVALPDGSIMMGGNADSIVKTKQGIGWAPFPVSSNGQNDQTTPNAVTCGVISSGTQNPRAAWTWLNFLAAHPILPSWSMAIPSQPSAFQPSATWGKVDENSANPQSNIDLGTLREAVIYSAEHGWYSNTYPEAVFAVNQALLKAVTQNVDLRSALEEASSQLEAAVLPTPDLTPVVVFPPEPTIPASAIPINYFTPIYNDRIDALAEEFHKQNPDTTLNISRESKGGVAGLADSYDCFAWLPEASLPTSMLLDLNQYLTTDQSDIRNDYRPQELEEYSQDGMLFALPTAYRPNLIYYNADLLTQRGLKPPEADWTYNDFMEMITSAASNGSEPIYGFALEYPTQDTDLFLAGREVNLVDTSGDAPAFLFDTPVTRNTLQWLAGQTKSGVIFPVTPTLIGTHEVNYTTARQLILDGRIAFWVSWLDQGQGGRYSLNDASFSIGVAPIPLAGGTGNWRPNQAALGQYISRNALNPDGCWAWIKFLSEQADNSFGIPARQSVRETEAWLSQVGAEAAEVYNTALEQRRTVTQESAYPLGPVRDWWNEVLAEVMFGADPGPLLSDLQGKADAYSACLFASSEYLAGDAQQKAEAENACAAQVNP